MKNQVLARLGIVVVLGAVEVSCGSGASGSDAPDGTGGKTIPTATGGASTGSGGASTGSGGASTGSGGASTGSGGASTGSGGAAPTGSGGVAPTGSGGAAPTGSGGASTGAGGATQTGSGGASTGGGGAAPTGSGGRGGAGSGGMGGTNSPSGDIWGGLKNPPRKSAGCDKPATLTKGTKTIMSGGMMRSYVIDIPASYDPATPYRLFYVGHGMPGQATDVAAGGWWNLKGQATAAKVDAIWIAPQGVGGSWSATDDKDQVLFDDITAAAKDGLCIDTTRIFAAGMSGGGMLSYSLSTARQKVIRAGFGMAPVNYRIFVPKPRPTDPIAWMQTTGMSDHTCPWINNEAQMQGAKFIALEKAADNGCTPATIPTWMSGNHVCYNFDGCKPGYPVKVCTFNGVHTHVNMDPGSNVNWIAKEGWEFLMQF